MALFFGSLTIPPAASLNAAGRSAEARQLAGAGSRSVVPLVYGQDRIGALVLNVLMSAGGAELLVQCLWSFAVDDIQDVLLNDQVLPAGATATHYTGAQTAPNAALVAAFAAQGITYTQALTGYAYSVLSLPTLLFDGQLNINARVRGRRLYDPRKDSTVPGGAGAHRLADPATWEWSDNPALALADFVRSDLYGAGQAVEPVSLRLAADACDAPLGAPPERRRVLGVSFTAPAEVGDIAESLKAYAGCFLLQGPTGVRLLPDADDAPVATYSHAAGEIAALEPLVLRDMGAVPTAVEVIYTDTSVQPWRDASAIAQLPGAGVTRPWRLTQVRMPGVHRYSQAMREAIERLNKLALNALSTSVEVFDIGIRHELGDIIVLSHPLGLAAAPMRVSSVSMPSAGRWRLSLVQHTAAAYSNEVATLAALANPSYLIPPGPPPNVTGLRFAIVPGGVRLAWDPVPVENRNYAVTRLSYGPTFPAAVFFWEGNSSDFVVEPPAPGEYLVWAVHVDRFGTPSAVPSSLLVDYQPAAAGADGLSSADVVLYQRSITQPALPSAAVVYRFSDGLITGLTQGWSPDIPQGDEPLWVIKARAIAPASVQTDSIGTGEWPAPTILVVNGVAGGYRRFVFRRAAAQPATPTGDNPDGWFDSPPAPNGNPLFAAIANFSAANTLIGAWSAPVQIEGSGVQVEYSVDGLGGWHPEFVPGDKWARYRVGVTADWSLPVKIVGEDGATISYIFQRSLTEPATPTGDLPANWFDEPPEPNGQPLWVSLGRKTPGGALLGVWSTPIRVEGADLEVEYSVNGINGWHPVFEPGDKWARYRVGPTGDWSDAVKIVGEDGANGVRTALLEVYQWAAAAPTTFPSGSSVYTWATGAFTAPPTLNGWSLLPGTPVSGWTLWACSVRYADTNTSATSSVPWNTNTAYPIGRASPPGTPGEQGRSVVRAYALYTGNPVVSGAPVVKSGTTVPAAGDFSPAAASAFSYLVPTPGTGQSLFVSDGVFDPAANTTTWTAPYLAHFRVGQLSALSADIGFITAGSIDSSGYVRVQGGAGVDVVGIISGTTGITRSAALVANTSLLQDFGVVGYSQQSGGNGAGVYGFNSNGVSGMGVAGRGGYYGTYGVASSGGGFGVYGQAPPGGGWGVYSNGRAGINGPLAVGNAAAAPLQVAVTVSGLPPPVYGGIGLHADWGLIFSDGVNWFRYTSPVTTSF